MNGGLTWRYATKKFDPSKKIPQQQLDGLLESLRFSPSSCGLQPWKFIIVRDAALRQKLRPLAHNQSQITDADTLIVFCCLKSMDEKYVRSYVDYIVRVRDVPRGSLAGFENMMLGLVKGKSLQELSVWMKHQIYIALGMLLNECAHQQIDACPMEGFDPPKFDEILGLAAQGLESVVLCTVGYRAVDDPYARLKKVRFEKNEVFINKS